MQRYSRFFFLFLILFTVCGSQAALAQKENLQIDYTVAVTNPENGMFHVTTEIKNIKQPKLDLSLPTWTPGWYTVENYFKNFLRFKITDGNGKNLPPMMSRKQMWNVDTKNLSQIKIEYDYRADTLALNQAKITKDFAFFTGTELFLQPEGHRQNSSTVHFSLPPGWKIISALKETSDPMTFTASDYDTLVDAPTEMGNFDVTPFTVEGKPHYFVATPVGAFSAEKAKKFTEMLAKVASAQSSIFGGLPYEKYVYFYMFMPPESNAGGALEHLNSHVSFAPSGNVAQPEDMIGTASHEFFHLWNVKRIRPAEMFPYDYSRENETPLLWVSEGFTNYYGEIGVYRAGLMSEKDFLASAGGAIGEIESSEVRNYISPANSSVSTWAGYDTPVAFGISYYTQGQNLGALLDLSIRHDTDGKASLDDVMRSLYTDLYKQNKGFTTEDMISIINRLTKKDYHDFYNRYVFGTEVPKYKEIFGYAGYDVERRSTTSSFYGINGGLDDTGYTLRAVTPNAPAEKAGVRAGDVITKIDGTDIHKVRLTDFAGKSIKLTVKRDNQEIEIPMSVGTRELVNYEVISVPQPNAQQLKIRAGWLKR